MNKKIDITPSTNIYNTFENFRYKAWDAIAEMVDNSTQSYKDSREIFSSINLVPKIYIFYYINEKVLQIIDNCFGVNPEKLDKLLKLNLPNKKSGSRNEFGMGLKTSSFWFGRKLSILSSSAFSNQIYKIELDLDDLENIQNNEIELKLDSKDNFSQISPFDYGTIIQVDKIKQSMTIPTLVKIAKVFSSKYRKDFIDDKLEIRVIAIKNSELYDTNVDDKNSVIKIDDPENAKPLEFQPIKIKKDENGNEIKITINDYLEHEGKKYNVNGWIGIAETGSRKHPGLTLFRNKRAILGDDSHNPYKPEKIFKDASSFEYQRIIGWLNLDDFPVTQQKNDFAWDSELQEKFDDFLYEKIIANDQFNLIKIAKTSRNRESEVGKEKIINKNFASELQESLNNDNKLKCEVTTTNNNLMKIRFIDDSLKFHNKEKEFIFLIDIIKNNSNKNWLDIVYIKNENSIDVYKLEINFDLLYFSPANNDIENIRDQIIKLAIYLAYSEIIHGTTCSKSSNFRNTLNWCFKNKVIK